MVGDKWRLTVKLKPPHGLSNPGGFDYQRWLFIHGIRATGYVINRRPFKLLSRSALEKPVDYLRQSIQNAIQKSVHYPDLAAILSALTVGSRSLLQTSQWQIFQNTGTSHLVAISGLHVGFIAAAIYWLINILWRRLPFLLLRLPASYAGAIAAVIGSVLYGLLAGFSLPTQRAVIMIVTFMLGELCYRMVPVSYRLLLAFSIIIFWEPFSLFSASFWLSFGAVAAIAYAMSAERGKGRRVKQWLRMQWVVFIGLLPLTLYFFQQLSLVALIANLIAIPWVGMVVVPLCLLSAIVWLFLAPAGQWLFHVTAFVLMPLWWYLKGLAQWSESVWHCSINSPLLLVTSLGGCLVLLAPKRWPGRWVGLMWGLPLFFPRYAEPLKGDVWFTLLDVGQGLSAVVRTAHHALVYDTGPAYPGGFDAGREVVVPYLREKGITAIDKLIVRVFRSVFHGIWPNIVTTGRSGSGIRCVFKCYRLLKGNLIKIITVLVCCGFRLGARQFY
ncbi:DNA internalization-related competence protein ComEC/Rec2 [Coxiella burnetii]|uniref:DNA internalization-related competence protein ComEC/Rec2 n=1 Tax=Coxiella burnetii TaxID=777 RepID=UPI0000DADE80|nr:DNA internalization-related competence protein ComEC/Rec2 [Coxiella burnetii]OYK80408.1 DNA internalization-related competence protein ComEC/Rec2 [Coxiella burnetii]OYK82527.1 DNA internalization-related competence protein ComEC/Rec2 [Coxiella burnetii]